MPIASFTRSPAAAGTPMTLDVLMQRAREIAERQGRIVSEPREMISPWQGAAQLAESFVNARQGANTENQLAQGRDALAKIRAGIDLEAGPTQQQISQASMYDPDYADKLTSLAAQAVQARRAREQQLFDRTEGRVYEAGQEAGINERERLEAIEAEKRAAAAAAGKTEQGRLRIITGEEAKTLGGDPARQYRVSADGTTLEDVTPDVPETFRPPTQEEIAAYGLKPDQPVRVSTKTGKPESIGGGPAVQVLPAEIGARVGMSDVFQQRYPEIIREIDAGNIAGPVDYAMGVAGQGRVGEVHRQIKSGVDALVRNLTGAGKSESEARDYAGRYLPQPWDTSESLKSKIVGLNEELTGVRSSVTYGRDAPAAPSTTGGGLPQGVTEEDIAETMRANNMTRQQVLDALAAQGGANGGP